MNEDENFIKWFLTTNQTPQMRDWSYRCWQASANAIQAQCVSGEPVEVICVDCLKRAVEYEPVAWSYTATDKDDKSKYTKHITTSAEYVKYMLSGKNLGYNFTITPLFTYPPERKEKAYGMVIGRYSERVKI